MNREISVRKKVITLFVMLLASVVILLPFFVMVCTSLKTPKEIQTADFRMFTEIPQWHNYPDAMAASSWNLFFKNSVLVTVLSILTSLVINSMAGFAFARMNFRGRDTLFFLALTGMMMPIQVTMLPNFVMMKFFPLAGGNNLYGQGGTGLINTYLGLLAPNIAGAFGVFLFRQFFMNFPRSLDDAAKLDGLSRIGSLVRIYVPLSLPVFATLIVLKATATWNEYTWPLIVTTKKEMWTVQLALTVYRTEFNTQWHLLMAATGLIMLPIFVLYLFRQKYFVEGIASTGIKG